jgi:type II secretory pathway component PulL
VAGFDEDEFDRMGDARIIVPWVNWRLVLASLLLLVIVELVLAEAVQLFHAVSTVGPDDSLQPVRAAARATLP